MLFIQNTQYFVIIFLFILFFFINFCLLTFVYYLCSINSPLKTKQMKKVLIPATIYAAIILVNLIAWDII